MNAWIDRRSSLILLVANGWTAHIVLAMQWLSFRYINNLQEDDDIGNKTVGHRRKALSEVKERILDLEFKHFLMVAVGMLWATIAICQFYLIVYRLIQHSDDLNKLVPFLPFKSEFYSSIHFEQLRN